MGDNVRVRKLLQLVAYGRRHPGARVAEVADAIASTPAEVKSLVEQLSLCGKPPFSPNDLIDAWIEAPDRVHVELDQSLGRPLSLTHTEALALSVALRALATSSAGPYGEAAESALAKLRRPLASAVEDRVAELEQRIVVEGDDHGTETRFATLSRALEQRRAVDVIYFSAGRGETNQRRVRPYALVQHLGAWYVVGHDDRRDQVRMFKVERIEDARLTDDLFEVPPDFDVGKYRRAGMFFGDGHGARIRFLPPVARRIVEEWDAAAVEQRADGSVILQLQSGALEWTAAWVMSFGGDAEALDPPELREAVIRRCREAQRLYE